MSPYEQGYQAGVCYMSGDEVAEQEKEAYLRTLLTEQERQDYFRGWNDGYSGIERYSIYHPEQAKA